MMLIDAHFAAAHFAHFAATNKSHPGSPTRMGVRGGDRRRRLGIDFQSVGISFGQYPMEAHPMKGRLGLVLLALAMGTSLCTVNGEQGHLTKFAVFRADRVTVWVSTGQREHLSCSITGFGNSAQMNCSSYKSMGSIPLVYDMALVVGSDGVAYVIACGGGLLRRIGCRPLTAGQAREGFVDGSKLSLLDGDKFRGYRVQTSAYIGPFEGKDRAESPANPKAMPVDDQYIDPAAVAPAVVSARRTLQRTGSVSETPNDTPSNPGQVMFISDPQAAEVYVDGSFVGSTPSMIPITPGSHKVQVTLKGYRSWTRTLQVATQSKVTVHAELERETA
jgi:hypothetical protein